MPNWCTTDVTITGNNDEIDSFINQVTAGYLIPEPDENDVLAKHLAPIDTRGRVHEGEVSFGSIIKVPSDFAINWYERGLELWGAKWDCRGTKRDDILITDGCANFIIFTPWSPPEIGVRAWAQAFPNLRFTCKVKEEGFFYAGVFMAQGDEYLEDYYDPSDFLQSNPSSDAVQSESFIEEEWSDIYSFLEDYIDKENIVRLANLLTG